MKKHEKQLKAFQDKTRFKYILAGRRGGKTELIVEDIIKTATTMPPGAEIFYIGPTNQQAKEIVWERLEERMSIDKWSYRDFISKQCFYLPRKRKIYVIGAEKIRRIRGHKVARAYLDEVAFFEQDLFQIWRAVRPALSDLKGGAIVSTTPNGKGTQAYDFYLSAMRTKDWTYHHWLTIDNPGIDPQEIEDAKNEMDEKSFRQEYMATWEAFEGLAYYNFNENIHIKKQEPISTEYPLILHFDFNVNPTSLVLGQKYGDVYRLKKEYSIKNSSTEKTVENFCEDFKHLKDSIELRIRGDSTGRNRSSETGRANYETVHEILDVNGFHYLHEVPAKNPSPIDRVQHVNNYLMNARKVHRLEVDPSCTDTIRDLSSQVLEGRFPSDKNNLGHKADAIGYGIYWDWINTRDVKSSTIQL